MLDLLAWSGSQARRAALPAPYASQEPAVAEPTSATSRDARAQSANPFLERGCEEPAPRNRPVGSGRPRWQGPRRAGERHVTLGYAAGAKLLSIFLPSARKSAHAFLRLTPRGRAPRWPAVGAVTGAEVNQALRTHSPPQRLARPKKRASDRASGRFVASQQEDKRQYGRAEGF